MRHWLRKFASDSKGVSPVTKKFHFVAGLPRAGTTVLSAVLNQNPRFEAVISNPLCDFVKAIVQASCVQGGYKTIVPEEKRKALILNLFDTFHDGTAEVFFNTNRDWPLLADMIADLLPDARIVCCVRPIPWVLDSFERLLRAQPYSLSRLFPEGTDRDVYARCDYLMSDDGPVGKSVRALNQGLAAGERGRILLVDYEEFCKHPGETTARLYAFLGEPYFEHDFGSVGVSYDDYDDDMNVKNLHTTRKKVEWIERKTILPQDIWDRFSQPS